MTMALDVVAFLEHAMDDAKAMNFAGLCYPVTGSVIVGAARTLRKGSSLKVELGSRNFHQANARPYDEMSWPREIRGLRLQTFPNGAL
jgi:hypothetical protein